MSEEKPERESPQPHTVDGDYEDRVIHEYDGIQEYDNRLPNWWLYTLFGTVAFAAVYWLGYHTFHSYDLPKAAYDRDVAAANAREAARVRESGPITAAGLVTLSKDASTVGKGKETFTQYCAACHKADGSGNIGPNLTDNAWLHGGAPDKIYATVNEGQPAKGMPAWGPQLGEEKTESVVAYVLTLKNTNVPGGKAPQGTVEE